MNGSQSRKMRRSLESSWGEANYSSDDGASVHTASSLSDDSESDFPDQYEDEDPDMATPLPPTRKASSQRSDQTPTRASKHRTSSRANNPPGIKQPSRSTISPSSMPRSFVSKSRSSQSAAPEPSFIMPTMRDSMQESSPRGSEVRPRRLRQSIHRRQEGTTDATSPPPRQRKVSSKRDSRTHSRTAAELVGSGHYISLIWNNFIKPLIQYAIEVVWYAMNYHLKPLLGVAFTVFLLASLIQYSSGVLHNYIQTALAPVCIIPGSSYLLPFCSTTGTAPSYDGQYPDFEELTKVQATFEEVLEANKDSHALPATLKKGEMALRDLRSTVKYSRLPSRSELEVELTSFIETASEASDHLAQYNAKIGYTMDQVISTNRWTLHALEGIADREIGTGSLSRALAYLNPFALQAGPDSLDELIFTQYVLHVGKMKEDIEALIQRSLALLQLLNALENRLDVIADIAVRDDLIVTRNNDELLSQLWTRLGGNRSSKKAFADSLGLLRQVQEYRKSAMQHVSATLLKLQGIKAELENLREGVAAPEVVGYGRVPLTWHIEVVAQSIERLRDSRGETLAVEKEALRRGLLQGEESGEGRLGLPPRRETVTVRTG